MVPLNQMHIFQKYADDMAHAKTPMFFQPLNALMIKRRSIFQFPPSLSLLSVLPLCQENVYMKIGSYYIMRKHYLSIGHFFKNAQSIEEKYEFSFDNFKTTQSIEIACIYLHASILN